ncbi:hypothetical protein [Sphingobium sp. CCH11-B1]|jgi:hypothetical protein|uniref:hypothetical protein n=1 Tax=Sphingobium sp. CCH11-B1 TaxID=1768781 RepID=UPI00082ADA87|nr:hypothetical protein [Sphingobium sp. CCH11-B1]
MRKFLWFVVAAICVGVASPVLALETGQCLPAATVRAALAQEGQNPIIVGNRSGYGYPIALIFTSNADGSKGYAIRGDKPFGEQAETACIDSVYRDVRLNDISKPGIPAWAKMGGDPKTAEAICKRDKLGYQEVCAPADQVTQELETNGRHAMMVATGSAINPRDKSIRQNQRILVTVNAGNQAGLIRAVTQEGAGYVLSAYSSVAYTANGEARLTK